MPRPSMRRPILAGVAVALLIVALAVPVLAAKPANAGKDAHAEKTPITLTGTIELTTDAGGHETYTLKDGGTTYTLEAGPPWFFGDAYPLEPYVGRSVTVEGDIAAGSTEVDVRTVDGTALRAPGKPPWAGGWRAVGQRHPGWSQEKADRMQAKFGDCFPPGQCKDKPGHAGDGDEDAAAESEAPD